MLIPSESVKLKITTTTVNNSVLYEICTCFIL